jgi:putative transposase
MPNHFHFLLKLKNTLELLQAFPKFETLEKMKKSALPSKQFANLFSSYTQAFNKKYGRKGSLFLKNFKRIPIDQDNYLSTIIAYIHLNPILHQFVETPEAWPWSSYNTIVSNSPTKLKRNEVIEWFGNREQFVAHHQQYRASKFREIQMPGFLS